MLIISHEHTTIVLPNCFTIGSSLNNMVQIKSEKIKSMHAEVRLWNGKFELIALGPNVYLNKVRVNEGYAMPIEEGMTVKIADNSFDVVKTINHEENDIYFENDATKLKAQKRFNFLLKKTLEIPEVDERAGNR